MSVFSAGPPAQKQTSTPVADAQQPSLQTAVNVSLWTMLCFSVLTFGLNYCEGLSANALPAFLGLFTHRETLIYLIVSVHPLTSVFVQPYVGWKGDRIWTRFGRRKPFFLLGVPFQILFLILIPYAAFLPHSLIYAAVFIFLFQAFDAFVFGSYIPMFGDIFGAHQRGVASGLQQVLGGLGGFLCLALGIGILTGKSDSIPKWIAIFLPRSVKNLGSSLPPFMTGWRGAFLLGGISLFVSLAAIMLVREQRPVHQLKNERFHPLRYYRELFSNRQWRVLYIAMLFLTLAPMFLLNGYIRFAQFSLGMSVAKAAGIFALWPLVQLLLSGPAGILTDRFKRRTVIYVSLALGIVSCLVGLFAVNTAWVYSFTALFALAITIQRVGYMPIVADYVPLERTGMVMGGIGQIRAVANFVGLPLMGFLIDVTKPVLHANAFRAPFVLALAAFIVATFAMLALGKSPYTDRA